MRIHVRKRENSWLYDFRLPGQSRHRKAGFKTKAAAIAAGEAHYEAVVRGKRATTLADIYEEYLEATTLRVRTLDAYKLCWKHIEPEMGHLYLEEVNTTALDRLKKQLPEHFSPGYINQHLALISTVLHFARKRELIETLPYVPKAKLPRPTVQWYTEQERDLLIAGMFEYKPRWYLFFYLTARVGLRVGEVYALTRRQVRDIPPQLIIDQVAERGTGDRPAVVRPLRKGQDELVLNISQDVMDAIRWHLAEGYAGPEYLFCSDPELPRYLESHKRPLRFVQKRKGLRPLSHHKIGRHSVGGQAMTAGLSPRVLQAQLGHRSAQSTARYANIGSTAQLQLMDHLTPAAPPHGAPHQAISDPLDPVRAPATKKGTQPNR